VRLSVSVTYNCLIDQMSLHYKHPNIRAAAYLLLTILHLTKSKCIQICKVHLNR